MSDDATLREALENIRRITALHYLGNAFDPEHMRAISNYCAGILNGEQVPDDLSTAPEAYFIRVLRENGWTVIPPRVTSVEPGCTCGGMAACPQCQDRDAASGDA